MGRWFLQRHVVINRQRSATSGASSRSTSPARPVSSVPNAGDIGCLVAGNYLLVHETISLAPQVNPDIKKDKWTISEDTKLTKLVTVHGSAWAEIARQCVLVPVSTSAAVTNSKPTACLDALTSSAWGGGSATSTRASAAPPGQLLKTPCSPAWWGSTAMPGQP